MFSPASTDIGHRLRDISVRFPDYVSAFDNQQPFTQAQLKKYLLTLECRSHFSLAAKAACDKTFARLLKDTLHSWRVDTRTVEIVPLEDFHAQLCRIAQMLKPLEFFRINSADLDVEGTSRQLWEIIKVLQITRSRKKKEPVRNKVVGGSKALHCLLPDLVFPIDRMYTETFFGWNSFDAHPEECFRFAFQCGCKLAKEVELEEYLETEWRSSLAKIIDNAIVGYKLVHHLKSKQEKQRDRDKLLLEIAKKAEAERH